MSNLTYDFAEEKNIAFELFRKDSLNKLLKLSSQQSKSQTSETHSQFWKLISCHKPLSIQSIQESICNHVEYTLAKTRYNITKSDCYRAVAYSIRDRLIESNNETKEMIFLKDPKRCYYLSLEYLLGRAMQNSLVNLEIEEKYKDALQELGYNLNDLYAYEHDPALGNGGLGRLAACFMDSMATMNLPCQGYGLRYTYGIFEQKIVNGRQVEYPDYWLLMANPWEICRHDINYAVRFNGEVEIKIDEKTKEKKYRWHKGQIVEAIAFDNPIQGYNTATCLTLRLWKAVPSRQFDFESFNSGRYLDAVKERQSAEAITSVLYPNDETEEGKILRLKQQYFFTCASLQDILRRFLKVQNRCWEDLSQKITIQLNDTHPTIAIAELMRILIDIKNLTFSRAWEITKKVFNYTNHTVLPEAAEKWSVNLLGTLLPRHLLIINDINFCFLNEVRSIWPDDNEAIVELSIYEENHGKRIRMANLAIIGSHRVNGVAVLHSKLIETRLFKHFSRYYMEKYGEKKFLNITNGVTPRRWIFTCNRELADLYTQCLGSRAWLTNLQSIRKVEEELKAVDISNNTYLLCKFQEIKLKNKIKLATFIEKKCNTTLDPETMLFDTMVKRIHEYKRQLLFLLYVLHRYLSIKHMTDSEKEDFIQPRACIMAGKAAPGYFVAKLIIKLANAISNYINKDSDTTEYLKFVFIPNYNISVASIIIPASDISEHISLAGTEASGTSNMKFVMNGGLIIGTADGANIEISEECGEETMFLFGAKEECVASIRESTKNGLNPIDSRLMEVFDFIRSGILLENEPHTQEEFNNLINNLCNTAGGGDHYLVCHDFISYCEAQMAVDQTYRNQIHWNTLCVQAASRMGKFNSDRTVSEYSKLVWNIEPFTVSESYQSHQAAFEEHKKIFSC